MEKCPASHAPENRGAGPARSRGEKLKVDRPGLAGPAKRLGDVDGHEGADAGPDAWRMEGATGWVRVD